MELTQEERDLILARRAERGEIEAALAFRQKAIKTAMAWLEWSEEEGLCLTKPRDKPRPLGGEG